MLPVDPSPGHARRLLRCYRQLDDSGRAAVLAFAEFLLARARGGPTDASWEAPARRQRPPAPQPEPRPAQETVVSAIKRLRRVYPMLDGSEMLTETSALMGAHVLQGRPAEAVIDELEALFAARYQAACAAAEGTAPGPSPDPRPDPHGR